MRLDSTHLKALESSVTGDFDLISGQVLAGYKPLVVKGFDLVDAASAVGKVATSLQLNVAGGILINYYASEAGSMFFCPALVGYQTLDGSNSRIQGAFVAGTTNYVGIDLVRNDDFTGQFPTTDSVKFLDIVSRSEVTRQVPIGRLLDFKIVISTQEFDFMPSVVPLMVVVTSSSNQAISITDARHSPYRLARGGSYPDSQTSYGWPQGREEGLTSNGFVGGDKAITSHKDWADAIMSRIWELGGGKYWYSPTADRNVRLTRTGATFTNGEWFEWDGTHLHWRGLRIVFDNSGNSVWYNTISDQLVDSSGNYGALATNLADGDCIYTDIVRTSNAAIGVKKGLTSSLGLPTVPGTRYILAWRVGSQVFTRDSAFPVGVTFTVATNTNLGIVQLTYAAGNPSVPKVAPQDANGSILNTATVLGNVGFAGTGLGSGSGVTGQGGASNGTGVVGTGGAANGVGVIGNGVGNAAGVLGNGGAVSGPGGLFTGGVGGGLGVSGVGAGVGAGVVATGQINGYGLDALGGLAGARIQSRSDLGANGPAILARAGNLHPVFNAVAGAGDYQRATIDHNGYRMGQVSEVYESWANSLGTMTTAGAATICPDNNSWTYLFDTGGSVTHGFLSTDTASYNSVLLAPGNVEGRACGIYQTRNSINISSYTSKIVYVAEFVASVNSGTGNGTQTFGLTDYTAGTNLDDQANTIAFVKRSNQTTWYCVTRVGDANTANVDSGVVPTGVLLAGQIFRIEIEGANCRFYINGVLRASTVATHPIAVGLRLASACSRITAVGGISVGPMRLCWNNYENPPTVL